MKFSMFTLAMMVAYTTAIQVDGVDLAPRPPRSILKADGCCKTAGCKGNRSCLEPYCSTGCYGDKPWLPLECKGAEDPCTKGCDPNADGADKGAGAGAKAGAKGAGGAGSGKDGAKAGGADGKGPTGGAASDFAKKFGADAKPDVAKVDTGNIAAMLRKHLRD